MSKISCLVCITNPEERQDIWRESISSMFPWADEIIVVNGGKPFSLKDVLKLGNVDEDVDLKFIDLPWPHDFSWDELPKHLNMGLKYCTGDWVVRADIDYVFKDSWKDGLSELEKFRDKRIVTAQKFSTVLANKVYQKGPTQMIINMKYGDMYFGIAEGEYTDLCVPIIKTGMQGDIPKGRLVPDKDIGKSHLEFMNYDYCFKTKGFTAKEFLRFSLAHKRYFGTTNWGETEEEALEKFINMMEARLVKGDRHIYYMPWQEHPSFIQERVKNIKPSEFGFDGWGTFKKGK